ncbi:PIG-L deacetylase family protein [Actinoplanes philippinensis]|uniref:PIG-L deacetylase family protein n=1 Tax=Actinoplanes philippinensis TaxID=35752 RepID=UPI0033D851CB
MLTRTHDITALGTILGVWAHPDDEAYLSGGLMALARDAGSRVVCATATLGERGLPDHLPPDHRTAELADSLHILGVDEHHWLGFRDGLCDRVPPAVAVDRISALIDEIRPDTVVSFGPDGNTGHPDHRAVARWTATAADRAPGTRLLQAAVTPGWATRWRPVNDRYDVFLPGFPILHPPTSLAVHLTLDGEILSRKVRALAAQATQTSTLIAELGPDYPFWVADEAFTEAQPTPAHPPCAHCWWNPTEARWNCTP